MTAADARTREAPSITTVSMASLRLVVHGRGLHSGRTPILRARVPTRSHPSVLAYADAPRADGGAGAVYVLLRK
jgi:DNA-nicking Smr family endonuclease